MGAIIFLERNMQTLRNLPYHVCKEIIKTQIISYDDAYIVTLCNIHMMHIMSFQNHVDTSQNFLCILYSSQNFSESCRSWTIFVDPLQLIEFFTIVQIMRRLQNFLETRRSYAFSQILQIMRRLQNFSESCKSCAAHRIFVDLVDFTEFISSCPGS